MSHSLLTKKLYRHNCIFFVVNGEIESIESLLFDLNTIKAATDNFADSKKLGEGGFGPVYKVIFCLKHDLLKHS